MTVAVTIRLDEAVLAKLDALAQDTSRSRDGLVQEGLADYLDFEAEQIAKIKEGLASADRGDFASDEEVARIFAKYKISSKAALFPADPYLASVSALLSEWDSPEDAEAYDGLERQRHSGEVDDRHSHN